MGRIEIQDEGIAEVAESWDALGAKLEVPPFMWGGWFERWGRAFSVNVVARTARVDGRLVGAVAFHGRSAPRSATNWHTPLFDIVAESDSVRERLLQSFTERPRWSFDLGFLQQERAEEYDAMLPGKWSTESRVILQSPYVVIDSPWDAYWKERSKNLRGTVRRCRNRLGDLGEVEVEESDGSGDLDTQLARGFRLEEMGWKSDRGTAILNSPQTTQFYTEIARWAADLGILRLYFLKVGERDVAFNYCFEHGGFHYLIKLGHDTDLQRSGPGTVLTAEILERCFEQGMTHYEFLGGADDYKMRWATGVRERVRLQGFSPGLLGRAERFVQTTGRATAKAVLQRMRRARS